MKRNGFTVIECIISLLLLSIVTALIMVIIPSAEQLQRKSFKNTTDWCLFLQRLENSEYQFKLRAVATDHLTLYSDKQQENFYIKGGKRAVYLQTGHGGYLPLLVNYCPASLHFRRFDDNCVQVKAKLADREERHAIVVFKTDRQHDFNGDDHFAHS